MIFYYIFSFLSNILPVSEKYYILPDLNCVYELNPSKKQTLYNDQLSLAYFTLNNQDQKIMFGKPHDILILEDIALRLSLEELGNKNNNKLIY